MTVLPPRGMTCARSLRGMVVVDAWEEGLGDFFLVDLLPFADSCSWVIGSFLVYVFCVSFAWLLLFAEDEDSLAANFDMSTLSDSIRTGLNCPPGFSRLRLFLSLSCIRLTSSLRELRLSASVMDIVSAPEEPLLL